MDHDVWLETAQALQDAALSHSAVARMVHSPRFETRGRGTPVRGVSLSERRDGQSHIQIGIVLNETFVLDSSVRAVGADIRRTLQERWRELGKKDSLQVDVHVVDLQVNGRGSIGKKHLVS